MPASSSPSSISPRARASRPSAKRLRRADLPAGTVALARFLIGCRVVHDAEGVRLSGRIVETEAYLPGDAASHAFRGETRRNRSMFLRRGHAYVYLSYGCWPVLNVTSEAPGTGAAVLIRALEPLEGIAEMHRHRSTERLLDLARGPGRLTGALRIGLGHDGVDLCAPGALFLAAPARERGEIITSLRIGITRDAERPLRFFEAGNPFVSGPRKLNAG